MLAKTYGLRVSEGLYDRLNTYYFVDGHALNDKPRLAQVAAAEIAKLVTLECKNTNGNAPAPMTEEEILTFLQGNQGRKEIEMALQALNDLGVHGIPKFVIEGRQVVDGAAHSSVFIDIFREIEARGKLQASRCLRVFWELTMRPFRGEVIIRRRSWRHRIPRWVLVNECKFVLCWGERRLCDP